MISTRLIIDDGMPFVSTTISALTGTERRPSISVRACGSTQAAQRDRGDTDRAHGRDLHVGVAARTVQNRRRGGRVERRQLVQIGLDVEAGTLFEGAGIDGDERAVGGQVLAQDARTGNGDFGNFAQLIASELRLPERAIQVNNPPRRRRLRIAATVAATDMCFRIKGLFILPLTS